VIEYVGLNIYRAFVVSISINARAGVLCLVATIVLCVLLYIVTAVLHGSLFGM